MGFSNTGPVILSNAIVQNVVADDNNSSTTNLAAGNSYTFTGTGTSTLGVAGIQVSLKADKECRVYVEQSPDNVNWDISDFFEYEIGGDFGITVQAVNSYTRVRVTTNSLTTTYFRLQTALCPIVEALPRSLDLHGNLKVSLQEDYNGFDVENTPTGEMRVSNVIRLVGSTFDGTTIDTNFYTTSIDVTAQPAAITLANGEMTLASGTNTAAFGRIYSVRRARYVEGQSIRFRGRFRVGDTGTANNKRRWGLVWGTTMPTITDGCYFELSGTTFSVVTLKGGVETRISSGSFDGSHGYTYSLDTNYHLYEIYLTGNGVHFFVDEEELHTIDNLVASAMAIKTLHQWFDTSNSNTLGGNVYLYSKACAVSRLGTFETAPTYKHLSGVNSSQILKYGAGFIHTLVIGTPVNNATITIYDNTSGTGNVMGVLTLPNSAIPTTIDYHIPFFNGLNIVPSSTSLDVTVIYE